MVGDELGVLGADSERDERAGVPEHRLPQAVGKLSEILMGKRQREGILSGFREDQSETVSRK